MLSTGAFAHVDVTMIEFHSRLAKTKKRKQQSNALEQGLFVLAEVTDSFKFLKVDDELYGNSHKPLPECDHGKM
jgi:hypothetical protein